MQNGLKIRLQKMFYRINLLASVIGAGIALFFYSNKLIQRKHIRILFCLIIVILTVLCAKLMYILELGSLGTLTSGFSLFGTIVFVPIFLILLCYFFNIDYFRTLSYLAPLFALALGQAKIGCFVAGCCQGIESSIGFPDVHNPDIIRFPVQLLEAMIGYILGILLFFYNIKEKNKSNSYSLYMIVYCICRLGFEFLREKERLFMGLTQTQFYCLVLIVIWSAVLLIQRRKTGTKIQVVPSDNHSDFTSDSSI